MSEDKPRDSGPADLPETPPETATETLEATQTEDRAEQQAQVRRGGLGLAAVLAAAALLGAGILALLGYQESQRIQTLLTEQQQRVDGIAGKLDGMDPRAGLQALGEELGQKIDALEAAQAAEARRIATLNEAIGAIHAQTSRSQRGWIIAEAAYLMRTANYRLHLARDIDGAIAALEAADQRLHELSDPSLLPVREALADEMQALREIERPDLVGLALRLDRMITGLKPLPPASPVAGAEETPGPVAAEGEEKSWEGLAKAVWSGLSEHITVRHHGTVVVGLPNAEIEMYLHQMLRLKLEAARLALLRSDDSAFHRQLESATAWIDQHFDKNQVGDLRAELLELDGVDLRPDLPDISGSLTVLEGLTGPQRNVGGAGS